MSAHDLFQLCLRLKSLQEKYPLLTHIMGNDQAIYTNKDSVFQKYQDIYHERDEEIKDEPRSITLYMRLYVVEEGPRNSYYWGNYFIDGLFSQLDISIIVSAFLFFEKSGFDPKIFNLQRIHEIDPRTPAHCTQHHFSSFKILNNSVDLAEDHITKDEFMRLCKNILGIDLL